MSFKSILVPFSGSEVDRKSLELAFVAARQFDGHIEGLSIRSVPAEILEYAHSRLQMGAYQNAVKELEAQAAQKVEEAHRMFDGFVAEKHIEVSDDPAASDRPTVSWQVAVGREADLIAQSGGAFDLLVISRPRKDSEHPTSDTLEAAIFSTGRPVLLAPAEIGTTLGESIVIGWNRSIQAGRAVFAAMPFLRRARQVMIVAVTTGAKRGPSHLEIARNLAWHGVNAQIRELPPDYRLIGEVLLNESKEFGADLLVMGAFSHSRLRERILGGVTKQILANAELPVFMAR